MLMNIGGGVVSGGGGVDEGSTSPPPPAPSSAPSAGVIVQVGPGSHSSNSATSTPPSSHLTSPVTTPPTPAPSSASSTFHNLFGVHSSNPLSFPAFSSNVTLTSNHVRAGSQDAAYVPNSPSTNITLPVVVPTHYPNIHNNAGGMAPLAVLSSPSLGSSPTSPMFSPVSSNSFGNGISIDVPTTGSSSLLSSSTLPSSTQTSSFLISNNSSSAASSSTFPVIQSSSSSSGSHMNSNAISPGTCSLNQSIAAGGIIGVVSSSPPTQQLQHCLLVSCNNDSSSSNLISTEAYTDNNKEVPTSNSNTTTTSSTTISIAPPPPSRSREHRKRERREKRRDRSYRTSSNSNSNSTSGHSHSRSGGSGHQTNHHHTHHSSSSVPSYTHHGSGTPVGNSSSSGTPSRHHHRHSHHHQSNSHRVKSSGTGTPTPSGFNNCNASSSSVLVHQGNSSNNNSPSGNNYLSSSANNNSSLCATDAAPGDGDGLVISEIQSVRGGTEDQYSVVSPASPPPPSELGPPPGSPFAGMPDLLDSHMPQAPPPYSTLPHQHQHPHPPAPPPPMTMAAMGQAPVPIPLMPSPLPVPLMPAHPPPPTLISPANCIPAQPVRYHFTTAATARASRRSMRAHRGVHYASEEEPKTCCGMSASQAVSIRWFIIVIAVIGICCTLAGTALGAARSAGKEHLTLSLLMIGVGVLLLTVSAVAWRLTANESGSSCRAMLGFARSGSSRGDGGSEPNRRFVPRLPPSYGRPHHPYAAMMYPEFQYRQPPPSYQASMQEYRLRLLLLERSNPTIAALGSSAMGHGPVMLPPPPYRPYSANMRMLPHARLDDYSRPPSYRSRSSGNNTGEYGPDGSPSRPSLDPSVGHNHHHSHAHHLNHHHHIIESPMHSRDPSILSYLSQQSVDNMSVVSGHHHHGNPSTTTATVVTVVQAVSVGMDIGLGGPYDADDDGKGLPSLEAVDDKSCYDSEERDNKDGNLVRIVQTTDSSQVIGRDSVIVTVSGGGGSNPGIWDSYHNHHHHHSAATQAYAVTTSGAPNNNNSSSASNIIMTTNNGNSTTTTSGADRDQSGNGGGGSEVQILAHL